MTIEEYDDLMEDDIVHFKNDNPNTHPKYYDFHIIHKGHSGIMIESEKSVPQYLEKDEALEKLIINKPEKISSWEIEFDSGNSESWNGKIPVILTKKDLKIIIKAIRTARQKGEINKKDMNYIFDKLNIED